MHGWGGQIIINGGFVTAKSKDGASIGTGFSAGIVAPDYIKGVNNDVITINGGKVIAMSKHGGAGIGGGFSVDGGNINITGGTIDAKSEGRAYIISTGAGGAGIGGGSGNGGTRLAGNGGTIHISGGTITAQGGSWGGAGIGGGGNLNNGSPGGSAGNITIDGGRVIATGGWAGAGIGAGQNEDVGNIVISGGTVFANNGRNYTGNKDVGGNSASTSNTSLKISGTAALFLRHNKSSEPVTVTHGHEIFDNSTEASEYTFPTGWDSEFGAWLPLPLSTISFDSAGGSAVAGITQGQGTVIIPPADPTREGYTFNGWNPVLPTAMPVNGLALKAQWKVNEYTITFDSNGGSEVADITQDYGTDITAPADPTREGYTFSGWNPVLPTAMPVNGLALKAQWTSNVPVPTNPVPTNPVPTVAPTKTPISPQTSDLGVFSLLLLTGAAAITSLSIKRKR